MHFRREVEKVINQVLFSISHEGKMLILPRDFSKAERRHDAPAGY